jgi:hypothetical protein
MLAVRPQSQGSVERANTEIKEMLISWMNDNDTTQWSEGLRFVQSFLQFLPPNLTESQI